MFTFVVIEPVLSKMSSGEFRSSALGHGTYALNVGTAGNTTVAGLRLTTPSGSIEFDAGFIFGATTAPERVEFTASSGTGRFRHTTGTLTVTAYRQTSKICDPAYPVPLFCSWQETLTFVGSIRHT